MTELFSARRLGVRYGVAHAVENVDLTVPENGVVALLGANGASKSSILKAIAGLIPVEVQMSFAGEDLSRLNVRQRARGGILYVAETETSRVRSYAITGQGKVEKQPWPSPNGGRLLHGLPGYQRFDSLTIEAG